MAEMSRRFDKLDYTAPLDTYTLQNRELELKAALRDFLTLANKDYVSDAAFFEAHEALCKVHSNKI